MKKQVNALDILSIREDFPILRQEVHGKPLIYFDNAATSQKPRAVIDRILQYYTRENSNVHRGNYYLSELASNAYEASRDFLQKQINAAKRQEIIFVRGATEGINLVASSWGRTKLNAGDEVLVTGMEHHANIVPWQQICNERGAKLRVVPVQDNGEIDLEEYKSLLSEKTKFVSIVHVSNGIGTINPVKEMISAAHTHAIPVLVDGCQAAPHMRIDVQELDADFYTFSGHKTFGPTGIGILYGKEELLEQMPPYQCGGDMIRFVSFEHTTFNDLPYKFEAGTPHIEGVVGLATAFEYLDSLGRESIEEYESELLAYANDKIRQVEGIRILGSTNHKIPVFSFVIDGTHPLDVGTMLDFEGVAIRTGNHCTQPLMERFGVKASCRASLAFYNTFEEVDNFIGALSRVITRLK